jgi:hypothetical protein
MSDHEGSPTPENEIAEDCMAIITKYRTNKVTKTKALSGVFGVIGTATAYTDEGQRDKAAETYVNMLDQHDASMVRANTRGEHSVQGPLVPEQMDDENCAGNEVEEVGDKRRRASTPDAPKKRVCFPLGHQT